MKISIGKITDRNISTVIETNIENGNTVYTDGKEYFVDVLIEDKVYRAPDALFSPLPDGEYQIINNNIYLVE